MAALVELAAWIHTPDFTVNDPSPNLVGLHDYFRQFLSFGLESFLVDRPLEQIALRDTTTFITLTSTRSCDRVALHGADGPPYKEGPSPRPHLFC